MKESVVIIPARLSSSRLPRKPLKNILGLPMIGHCLYRANFCKDYCDIYIATCDQEIKDYVNSIGGKVIMTSNLHKRASTRTQEALEILDKQNNNSYKYIIMLQGDEPLVRPKHIENILLELNKNKSNVVNLVYEIKTDYMFADKNNVKVAIDNENNALYFSREAIPSNWQSNSLNKRYIQSGIIGFSFFGLNQFNSLKESFLEIEESVDLNRLIENGKKIKLIKTSDTLLGVDTAEDLDLAENLLSKDSILKNYKNFI